MNDKLIVDKRDGLFVPNVLSARTAHRYGLVGLIIDGRVIEMKTPKAHRTGFDMCKLAGQCLPREYVVLNINDVEFNFPPQQAKQVGGSLLRKADDADDFQLRFN